MNQPSDSPAYLVPSGPATAEVVIKRSRFIAFIERAENTAAAMAFIDSLRQRYPDARHHCWAYIAGPPENTADIGLSDDGEPHGTAGRPMMTVLAHSGVGEIVAVVVRYFGGTKLGTGGLVRAYSSVLQEAMELLPTERKTTRRALLVEVPFQDDSRLRQYFENNGIQIDDITYTTGVTFSLSIDAALVDRTVKALADLTSGRATCTHA